MPKAFNRMLLALLLEAYFYGRDVLYEIENLPTALGRATPGRN
jgi:hypothetical protein